MKRAGMTAIALAAALAAGVATGEDDGSQVLHPPKPKIVGDQIGKYPVACTARTTVAGEAPSLLPDGHEFKLVWADEFNGDTLDMSKWSFRTNFWGRRAHWFAAPEDGCVEVRDGVARLKVKKLPNGQFVSPQLQTGCIMWDVPWAKNPKGFWPPPGREKPKFVHKYGYYECRLRLQRKPGWWSAFWMQTEMQGCCLDPSLAGIEHDIMESFYPGDVSRHMFHYDGYGPDYKAYSIPDGINDKWIGSLSLDVDEFHTFGLLWEPDGYTTFVDGRRHGEKTGLAQGKPVSQMPEFILISTECMWYRKNHMTGNGEVAALEAAVAAGDCFTVDFVRVYDIVDR